MSDWPRGSGEMAARIRGHDWAATPLGPAEGWPDRLRLMVEQVLASPLVASVACGAERVLIYNDAAASLYGGRHPGALGRPLPDAFPESYPVVAHFYDRVYAGESLHVPAQALDVSEAGGEVFDAYLTPVRDAGGRVIAAHMVGFEIGESVRAQAALRRSEEKYRTLFEAIDEGFCIVEVILDETGKAIDLLHLEANEAYERYTGLHDIVGKRALEIIPEGGPWIDFYGHVALTGQAARDESYLAAPIERWIASYASRIGGDGSRMVAIVFNDITERRRAEDASRAREERQAFLLKLTDLLRSVIDPLVIQDIAARTLGEHLDADRAYYAVVEGDYERAVVEREYLRGDAPSVVGTHLFSRYGTAFDAFRNGRTMAVDDLEAADAIRSEDLAGFRALSIRSLVNTPLVKGGRSVAGMTVLKATPHEWTEEQVSLVEEVAERTWAAVERARAEAALRESEERFAQFAASSSDGLWIRDAGTLAMEYTSPAIGAIYGIVSDGILGDMARWLALVEPEDRDTAIAHIRQAQAGASVTHEFRIRRPSDGDVRWIRNTDFPLRDAHGRVQRIGGIAEDVTEARELRERQGVLVGKLQHRTRNLMGLVRAMADKTMARSADLPDFRERFSDRLAALARVQGQLSRLAEGARIAFDDLIRAELAALNGGGGKVTLEGPEGVALRSSTVQTFALALHELCTNAGKYGAFAQPDGRLHVRWRVERAAQGGRPWLHVDWRESGVKMPTPGASPQGGGSGRELIERALPYQLGARTTYVTAADGVHCTIALPVSERRPVREEADV